MRPDLTREHPEILALARPYTGPTADVRPLGDGRSYSDYTGVVTGARGAYFVKAMRNRGWRRESILRERAVNPFVRTVSPALRWSAEDADWIVLGFEVLPGRRPDLRPGSPDLPAVARLLTAMGAVGLPACARDWTEVRWDRFAAGEDESRCFRGEALLHADLNPANLQMHEGRCWALDWGWPTRGAAFIDPAMLVVQLVAAGHRPGAAEAWAAACPAWAGADPRAVDAFAAASVRMWWDMVRRAPDRPARRALAEAAESWATHRGMVVT
jgi:hypothetical protein